MLRLRARYRTAREQRAVSRRWRPLDRKIWFQGDALSDGERLHGRRMHANLIPIAEGWALLALCRWRKTKTIRPPDTGARALAIAL